MNGYADDLATVIEALDLCSPSSKRNTCRQARYLEVQASYLADIEARSQ
jgi:hypothetical protein